MWSPLAQVVSKGQLMQIFTRALKKKTTDVHQAGGAFSDQHVQTSMAGLGNRSGGTIRLSSAAEQRSVWRTHLRTVDLLRRLQLKVRGGPACLLKTLVRKKAGKALQQDSRLALRAFQAGSGHRGRCWFQTCWARLGSRPGPLLGQMLLLEL